MLTSAASAPAGRLWLRIFRRTDPRSAYCVLHLRRLHGHPAMSDSDPVVLPSAMRHPQWSAHDLDDSERTRYTTCVKWAACSLRTTALPCSALPLIWRALASRSRHVASPTTKLYARSYVVLRPLHRQRRAQPRCQGCKTRVPSWSARLRKSGTEYGRASAR